MGSSIKYKEEMVEKQLIQDYPLFFLEMNEMQDKFIRVVNDMKMTPKRRLLESGNKCLTYGSLVETREGEVSVGELYERGEPFEVYAWDGKDRVVVRACAPFLKEGCPPCLRITMDDGRWVETSEAHRVLTSKGWISSKAMREAYLRSLQESSGEVGLSVLPSGVVHWSGILPDCQERCFRDYRQCGELPRMEGDNGQGVSPLSGDALQRKGPAFLRKDGRDSRHANSLLSWIFHLSTFSRVLDRYAGRFSEFLSRAFYTAFPQSLDELLMLQQLSIAGDFQPQSYADIYQCLPGSDSVSFSCSTSYGNRIVSVKPIPCQRVYDFTVPIYHNYFAGGLIHHNTGKTHIGIAEDLGHIFGKRYWLGDEDTAYKVDVRVPNRGLVGCETLSQSVMQKIWPTIKYFIPKSCRYTVKKNPQGHVGQITFHTDGEGVECGSELFIRSYDQEPDTFEGIDYDWIHWDEPPPKKVLQAAERGKIVSNAPSWFTMTPLKEAYIYDEYSNKAFNNGGEDQEIAVIRGEIWDNCVDWCSKCKEYVHGNSVAFRKYPKCPRCGKIMGWIPVQGIREYLKTLDPEEMEAREKGLWRHLSGLVYKGLERETHVYEDFPIPRNWMRIEGCDPHDARATCYLFGAVSPEEIEIFGKTKHRIYFYDYMLSKGEDMDTFVRKVRMKREEHGYSKPKWIILDAKYGARTEMESRSWEDELRLRGLGYIKLSQSKPGDVELGHKIVREYLKTSYSMLTGKAKAGIMFAKAGCGGHGGPIHHMFNYQYKDGVDKPDDEYKDFPDIARYICMEQPVYIDPENQRGTVEYLEERRKAAYATRRR